ncbi:MAG: ABC transporter permease, partial [Candidatus Contubernalis sp.]|nr:ABC transporter permease [Candidatus Contubernalis sp.]
RREIGMGMALGVPRLWLAVRPLLVGLQIAFLGTIFGLPLALVFIRMFGWMVLEFMPLPYTTGTMLHPPSFIKAAALGIFLPLLAVMIPVWQAVNLSPLEAMKGHIAAKSSGLNRWFKGLRLPGSSFTQMPLRNILRTPKRTFITVLGISVAIALLLLFLGLLDTFMGTLTQANHAIVYRSPNRVVMTLNSFYPTDHELVRDIASLSTENDEPLFSKTEPGLMLGGRMLGESQEIKTLVEFYPSQSNIWKPALLEGSLEVEGNNAGIVISRKAAEDLDVNIGDKLTLEHPYREGPFAFRNIETTLTVSGIHDNPLRGFSYTRSFRKLHYGNFQKLLKGACPSPR